MFYAGFTWRQQCYSPFETSFKAGIFLFFFFFTLRYNVFFLIQTIVSQQKTTLRYHIKSTTGRVESVRLLTVNRRPEQLSPRWTHFNYSSGTLPAGFHPLSAKTGGRARQQRGATKLPGKHHQSQVNAFLTTPAPESCQGSTSSPVSRSWESQWAQQPNAPCW